MIRHPASLARDHSKLIRMNLVKQVGHKMTYFAELVQLFTQGWGYIFGDRLYVCKKRSEDSTFRDEEY